MRDMTFWAALDRLAADCPVVIDRPKNSRHPRHPDIIYPLDYGYLEGTSSMDGGGIDVWRGTEAGRGIVAILCIVDLAKKDSEIKILLDCSESELALIHAFHNHYADMKGILIQREKSTG